MNISNINFKGCKNLITMNRTTSSGCQLTMLAGELTDEVSPDLTKWHEIQKKYGEQQPSDTFALIYSKTDKSETMSVNTQLLLSNELQAKGHYNRIENPKIEEVTLGTYTLFARVMNEISNSTFFDQDKSYFNVFKNLSNILKLLCGEKLANIIAVDSVSNLNFRETAAEINKIIARTMTAYFK